MRSRIAFRWMLVALAAGAAAPFLLPVEGKEGRLLLRREGAAALIQVLGDEDDDWQIEASGDLVAWTNLLAPGTILAEDRTNAPSVPVDLDGGDSWFLRARRTAGLYDRAVLRTFSLTFTQTNC